MLISYSLLPVNMTLKPIIGLEIHVQLKTKSKMFCGCDNTGENQPPNTTVCPICMGHPGVLPVANRQAIEWSVMTAQALNCEIPEFSKFDRKNYFYPDLPKGYQISQYDQPIGVKGFLEITDDKGEPKKIQITRLHLEEDAAKNFHSADGRHTFVDYNRACTPLMEIVSEPDMNSPKEAKKFVQELRLMMKYLNVSEADMEKGHLRCDANINLWELDDKGEKIAATPIVEVKNMNSFKSVERAMEYEIKRQTREYQRTKKTIKDHPKTTRGWNDDKGVTEQQRTKEEAHDYRYFPEPDLPPLNFSPKAPNAIDIIKIKADTVELPAARRERFIKEYQIDKAVAKQLVEDKKLAEYFEEVDSELREWLTALPEMEGTREEIWAKHGLKVTKLVINWLINKLMSYLNNDNLDITACKITPENFAEFITIIYQKKINSTIAQKLLEIMYQTGKDPSAIIDEQDLTGGTDQIDINKFIETTIAENPDAIANYKKGKTNSIMYLVGQVMKKAHGKADAGEVKKLLENKLTR